MEILGDQAKGDDQEANNKVLTLVTLNKTKIPKLPGKTHNHFMIQTKTQTYSPMTRKAKGLLPKKSGNYIPMTF